MKIRLLALATFVSALGWLVNKVGFLAMKRYCREKGMLPTDEEMDACLKETIRKDLLKQAK